MRRRTAPLLLIAILTVASLASPGTAAAVMPTPAAPMKIVFEAGSHVGYHFNLSTGAILGSRRGTLAKQSSAQTVERRSIPGRGVHLRVANGIWAGYWVRESMVAYVAGIVGEVAFAPARTVSFQAGRTLGYRFDASWGLVDARVVGFSRPSSAAASSWAMINGVGYFHVANGAVADRWVPSGGATVARKLDCRTGPKAGGGAATWSQLTGAGPEVALTFDLGGRTDPAMAIAKRLLLHGVCTTIFPTGDAAATAAGGAVLEFMDDYPAIFEYGNHTKDHCDLVRGGGDTGCPTGRPSASFVASQLTSANTTIQGITGQSTAPYWRPPYGSHDAAVRSAAASAGYTKTVMWHIDTIDWLAQADGGPSAYQIATKVASGAGNGSIVLMHLGGWNTHAALPSMIHGLRNRGFATTSISDLVDGS